jgi:hypothetical protein
MAETFTEAKFAQMVRELGPQRAIAEAAERDPSRVAEYIRWVSASTTGARTVRAIRAARALPTAAKAAAPVAETVAAAAPKKWSMAALKAAAKARGGKVAASLPRGGGVGGTLGKIAGSAALVDAATGIVGTSYRAASGQATEVPDDFMTHGDFEKEGARLDALRLKMTALPESDPQKAALRAEFRSGLAALQPYAEMFSQMAAGAGLSRTAKSKGPRSLWDFLGAKYNNLTEFFALGLPTYISKGLGNETDFGVSPSTGTFSNGAGFVTKSATKALSAATKSGALPTAGTPPPATEDTQAPATEDTQPTDQTQPPEDLNAGIPPPPRLSRQQAYQMTKDAMEMAVAAHGMTPDGFRLYAMRSRLGNALAPAERKAVASKVQSIVSMAETARAELMAPYAAQLQAYQAKYAAPAAGSQDPALGRLAMRGMALEAAQEPIKEAIKARADYEAMSRNAFGAENLSIVNENTGATEPAFNKEMLGRISSKMQQAQARAKQDTEYAKLYQASARKFQESVANNDANGVWAAIQSLNPAPPALPTGTPPTAL